MNRTLSRRLLCRSAVAGLGAAALGAGCRTTAPAPVPGLEDSAEPDPTRGHLGRARDGVLAWLETVRWKPDGWGRWKYNAHMARDYGLQMSLECLAYADAWNASS